MKLPISSTAVPLLLYGLQLGGPYLLTFLKNHICRYLSFHPNPGNFELIKYSSSRKMYTFFCLEKLDFPMKENGKPFLLENISQVASTKSRENCLNLDSPSRLEVRD